MSVFLLKRASAIEPPEPTDIVRDNLLLEYRFDASSGQVLVDASGNSHDAQLGSGSGSDTNDPAWASPRGLSFASNDYVVLASLPTLNPPFTVQVVSQRTGSLARTTRVHLRNGSSTRLILQNNNTTDAFRAFDALGTPSDNAGGVVGTELVSLTVTVPASGTARGYINDTEVLSYASATTYNINNIYLGASHGTSEFFGGIMLYVVLYTAVLTPEQIAANNGHYAAIGIL